MKPLTNEAVAKKKDTAMAIVKYLSKLGCKTYSKGLFCEEGENNGWAMCITCRSRRFLKQSGGKGK